MPDNRKGPVVGFISIKHAVGEAVIDESALSVYEERGWKRADPKAEPAPTVAEVAVADAPAVKTSKEN